MNYAEIPDAEPQSTSNIENFDALEGEKEFDSKQAHNLLRYLEQDHRQNLFYHLYSIHLLKQVLLKNNTSSSSIDSFISKHVPKFLSTWPRSDNVFNPNTDKYYFDDTLPSSRDQGVSMMNIEIQAIFERKIREKFDFKGGDTDLHNVVVPHHFQNSIFDKIDNLLTSLQLEQMNLKLNKKALGPTSDFYIDRENAQSLNLRKIGQHKQRMFNYRDILKHSKFSLSESFEKLQGQANYLFEDLNTTDKLLYKSSLFKIPQSASKIKTASLSIKQQKIEKKLLRKFRKKINSAKSEKISNTLFKNDIYTLDDALIHRE